MNITSCHFSSIKENRVSIYSRFLSLILIFLCFVCLTNAVRVSAGSDLQVFANKTLTSKFNKYDKVTVKNGVTLTLAERAGEPVGLEITKKLVVEEGAKITGYGLLIFDKNATYEGIDLYYKYKDQFCKIPRGMSFVNLGDDADDYKPNFEFNKQKGIYVLMGEFNGGDPFELVLNRNQIDLVEGGKFKLSLSGIKKGVTFKSDNKEIVLVSKKGVIKAKQVGEVTVTAKYEGKEYKCEVRVVNKGLSSNQLFMNKGEEFILQFNGAKVKKVESSNQNVAKISKKLVVSAFGEGECTLYVYDSEGNMYSCKVCVYNC